MSHLDDTYDVAILGSGMAGTITATVLAKQGFRVLLLERGAHPRFAIGESMLPQGVIWLWMLGQRYQIPELLSLAHFDDLVRDVSPRSGIKRTFGFVYHRDGTQPSTAEMHKLIPPELPFAQEAHYYREDIDHYLLGVAIRYGVVYRDRSSVDGIDVDADGVTLTVDGGSGEGGARVRARLLLDGAGYRSPTAQLFDLREDPTRLATRSRSIFTHVDGLRPFDDVLGTDSDVPQLSASFHEGTLHHVFDGGWFWVIPFDNHSGSPTHRASIGVTVDLDRHPPTGLQPAEEFHSFVAALPGVAAHFDQITPVRPFVGTGRLQYSATAAVTDRVVLLPHAYGFVDPLFSQGLLTTLESIVAMIGPLSTALDDDDLTPARLGRIDRMYAEQLDTADRIVSAAYASTGTFASWNAWLHTWLASKLYGDLYLTRSALKFAHTGDPAILDDLAAQEPRPAAEAPFAQPMADLLTNAGETLGAAAGQAAPLTAAADQLLAALAAADWLPHGAFKWGDGDAHHVDFHQARMLRTLLWGRYRAPRQLRRDVFDFPVTTLGRMARQRARHPDRPPAVVPARA